VKAPAPLALFLGFCAAVSPAVGQVPTSGGDAVRNVDWVNIRNWSPIPETFPTADSDDPVEAGFARQWLEQVLQPRKEDRSDQLILTIVSTPRNPNDQWSYKARAALRDLVRTDVPDGRNARVFCNQLGCLCYVERGDLGWDLRPTVYTKLKTARGREAPFGSHDTFSSVVRPSSSPTPHAHVPWELTVVIHGAEPPSKPSLQ